MTRSSIFNRIAALVVMASILGPLAVFAYSEGTYTPPPGAPGAPTFTNVAQTTMRVNWAASSGSVTNYRVERCQNSGCSNFSQIATNITTLYYDDSGLTASTVYRYRVRANGPGGLSGYSEAREQQMLPNPPASAPGTPTFTDVAQTSVRVNWTAVSGATNYKVERCSGSGCSNFSQIASNVTSLFFDSTSLTPNTLYRYRVRGNNTGGDGPYSNIGEQTTLPNAPDVPGTPSFTNVTASTVRVNWTAATGATSYRVERCQGGTCSNFSQTAQNLTNLYYDDSGLLPSTYRYRVRAVNSGGLSGYSGIGTVSTAVGGTDWMGPASGPPTTNVPEPINIGSQNQVKDGVLGVGGMGVFGDISLVNTGNRLYLYNIGSSNQAFMRAESGGDITFHAGTAGVAERMRLTPGGNLGIGTTNPGQRLTVAGPIGVDLAGSTDYLGRDTLAVTTSSDNGWATLLCTRTGANNCNGFILWSVDAGTLASLSAGSITSTSFLYPSDARLKENVTALKGNLAKVLALAPVSFTWKDDARGQKGKEDIGFIAQDLEKIVPEVVHTDENGYKTVDYPKLVPVVVGALKEQRDMRERQQREIDMLHAELQALHN